MKRKLAIATLALTLSISSLTACGTSNNAESENKIETESAATEKSESVEESTESKEPNSESDEVTPYESAGYTFQEMSKTMVCNVETAPVYVKPNENSSIFTFVKKDNQVTVISKCNEADYYGISINGETGYIKAELLADYVEPVETEPETETPQETPSSETQESKPAEIKTDENKQQTNQNQTQTNNSDNKNTSNNSGSGSNSVTTTASTTKVTPTTTVDGFKYALYTPYTLDDHSAYFYYVIGEENYTPYTNTVSTIQTNLNAQKYPYWQVTACGATGTYSGKQIGVALCETFSTPAEYTNNKTARATTVAGTASIWE